MVTEWQGTRVLRQPEENVSGSPDYRITPSEKGGAPTLDNSQGDQNQDQPQHQPTCRSQRLWNKQNLAPEGEQAQILRIINVLGELPKADLTG